MATTTTTTTLQIERQGQKKSPVIGASIRVKEDYRHIRGAGSFVDDIRLPNTAYAHILRSPYAHAKIKRIDCSEAMKVSGVIDILTAEDVVRMSDPLPQMTVPPASNLKDYPIAVGKVRYVGEPIAVVVAESRYVAEDAAELIVVEYEALEPVLDAERAFSSRENLIHEAVGSNVMGHVRYD